MSLDNMYFALAPNKFDISVILETRPRNILVSYALWKDKKGMRSLKSLVKTFWSKGYYPKVMLDSGAYSFRNDREDISFLDVIMPRVRDTYYDFDLIDEFDTIFDCIRFEVDLIRNYEIDDYYYSKGKEKYLRDYNNLLEYIDFIEQNGDYISSIISLDDIFNEKMSKDNWMVIKSYFDNAIPTFHFGEDMEALKFYIDNGAKYIGLGGVALAKQNGCKLSEIIDWVNECSKICGDKVKLHLFGCQDDRILNNVEIHSADGASWIISAALKHKKLGVSKFELACDNVKRKEVV